MKQNVRYWGHYLLETLETAGIVLVFLYVLMAFNFSGSAQELLSPLAALAMGMALLLRNLSAHVLYIPLQIAMGDTRRNAFLGFQLFRAAALAAVAVVAGLAMALGGMGLGSLPALLLILTTVCAGGSLLGAVWSRLKVMGIILIVLICGCAGGVVGFLGASGDAAWLLSTLTVMLEHMNLTLAVIAAALAALDLGVHWLCLRRQTVKY